MYRNTVCSVEKKNTSQPLRETTDEERHVFLSKSDLYHRSEFVIFDRKLFSEHLMRLNNKFWSL